jgi:hypothetical protein
LDRIWLICYKSGLIFVAVAGAAKNAGENQNDYDYDNDNPYPIESKPEPSIVFSHSLSLLSKNTILIKSVVNFQATPEGGLPPAPYFKCQCFEQLVIFCLHAASQLSAVK